MPALPVLFRPIVHRLMGKHKGRSSAKGTGYVGASSRRVVLGDTKQSATTSAASYPVLSPGPDEYAAHYQHIDPRTEQIQAVTTIDQTYWRNNSDELPLQGSDIELGSANHGSANHGFVGTQAWAEGPRAGLYGVPHNGHQ